MNPQAGSRAAALAPGSPAPHHEAQLPRANTALPSPQLGNGGEKAEGFQQQIPFAGRRLAGAFTLEGRTVTVYAVGNRKDIYR
jgi:hypothetical protein